MVESAAVMMQRFSEATRQIGSPDVQSFFQDRIYRLREDLNAFTRDLKFLDEGGTILFAPDSAEIESYLRPQQLIGLYCFPLEDRSTFDSVFAQREGRPHSFSANNANHKISRRIVRARAHLFGSKYRNILLPPYFSELDLSLSMILATRGRPDLGDVFKMIERNASNVELSDEMVRRLESLPDLSEHQRQIVLDDVFDRVVADPIIYADALRLESKDRRISEWVRANDFLLNARVDGIDDYDWSQSLGEGQGALSSELRHVVPDRAMVEYLEGLFFRLPTNMTNLAIYADAQALGYVAAINGHLQTAGTRRVKVQLVSWALSPVRVSRAFWPESRQDGQSQSLAEVRHPKLLAGAIDFTRVNRGQVLKDLERFSNALNLYRPTSAEVAADDEALSEVRSAWAQLDNTLLAWTSKISPSDTAKALPAQQKRLEVVRQTVSEHRAAFENYLVVKIDTLSKALSDSHWRLVQPADVGQIAVDVLFYKHEQCIVIRPQADYARFAIALYNADIMKRIYDDFQNGKSFGYTLADLIATHGTERPYRAEMQLLKAFLFSVQGDNIFAARYCRLARSELVQTEFASNVLPEVLYLAHYAHREIGKAKRSTAEFGQSFTMLEDSQSAWKPSLREPSQLLRSRYFISWITTCREIAATGLDDFVLGTHWSDRTSKAYEGCLQQLGRDIASVDEFNVKLESYQTARAAQNVMFVFLFHKYNVGSWLTLFGKILRPTEEHFLYAWNIMRQIRASSRQWGFLNNMTRNDLAFAVGSCLYAESKHERDEAWETLLELGKLFETDRVMQRVAAELIRAVRKSRT
jgi:hypothetical protein